MYEQSEKGVQLHLRGLGTKCLRAAYMKEKHTFILNYTCIVCYVYNSHTCDGACV